MKRSVLLLATLGIVVVAAAIYWTWQATALLGLSVLACYLLGPLLRKLREVPETAPIVGSLGRWLREDGPDILYLYDKSRRNETMPWPVSEEPQQSRPQPVAVEREPYIEPEDMPEFIALTKALQTEYKALLYERPASNDPYYRILLRLDKQPGLDFSLEIAFDYEYDEFNVVVGRRSEDWSWQEDFTVGDLLEAVGGLISGHVRILERSRRNDVAFEAVLQVEQEGQWLPISEWHRWTWLRLGAVTERVVQNPAG